MTTTNDDTSLRFSMIELDDAVSAANEWDDSADTKPNASPDVVDFFSSKRTGARNLAEAIEQVPELGGTVEKVPLYLDDGMRMPRVYGTVRTLRDGTRQGLAAVGERYRVIQDSEAFAVMDALASDGTVSTMEAGVCGAKSWIRADMGIPSEVRKSDIIDKALIWSNSHDGSIPLAFGFTGNRRACFNTCHFNVSRTLRKLMRVRHTAKAVDIVKQVHEAIRLFNGEFDQQVLAPMRALTQVEITETQLKEYCGTVFQWKPSQWADQDSEETEETSSRVYARVLENYESGRGSEYSRGTAWGAYNAVTEYLSHQRSRSQDPQAVFADLQFGNGAVVGRRAWDAAVGLLS